MSKIINNEDGDREVFNFVVGFVRTQHGLRDGLAVMNPEKTIRLEVDQSRPTKGQK